MNFVLNRFWSYVQLISVIAVTWIFEFPIADLRDSSNSLIIEDVMRCLTAVVIFAIFTITKKVHLLMLQRYSVLV